MTESKKLPKQQFGLTLNEKRNSMQQVHGHGSNMMLKTMSIRTSSLKSVKNSQGCPDIASICNEAANIVNNDQLAKINDNLSKLCVRLGCAEDEDEDSPVLAPTAPKEEVPQTNEIDEVHLEAALTKKPVVSQAVLAKRTMEDASNKRPKFQYSGTTQNQPAVPSLCGSRKGRS